MERLKLRELIDKTAEALKDVHATEYHLRVFRRVTKQLLIYAKACKVDSFSMDFGLKFLDDHYSMSQWNQGKRPVYIYVRCINALSDFQRTGHVVSYLGKEHREYDIPEGFKPSTDAYLAHRKRIGIVNRSIQVATLHLERFYAFLIKEGITEPEHISISAVHGFLESLSVFEKPTINHTMRTVRQYLKFCFENGFSRQELFTKIPNVYYNRQSKLPSVYSAEEVNKLLESVDQGNPCSKRDYAIILLISRLGLRSSDVANLRFSNIDWENELIRLNRKKNNAPIELPLLEDVGSAIINYLKYARPKTGSNHVFVKQKPPFTEFQSGSVGAMVCRYLQKSGIRLEGRKKGSHTLRHSLASRLLEHKVPLPVISDILGHTNTETTMAYLRIDAHELKKCALEVIV